MRRRQTKRQTNDPTSVAADRISPVGLAHDIGTNPLTYDDDRVNPDHNLKTFGLAWETTRAEDVGGSAGAAVIAEGVTRQITPLLGEAAEAEAKVKATRKLRDHDEEEVRRLSESLVAVARVPDTTLSPKREILSLTFKAGFFVGDSTILALLLNRAGSPLALSLLAGVSLASSMVAVGSTSGHRRAAFDQREGRGDPPANCDSSTAHLFRQPAPQDLRDDEEFVQPRPDTPWLVASLAVAIATFTGLLMLGLNAGDGAKLALGAALLAAVTVVGSAAAEAFGTNEGADMRKRLLKQLGSARKEIESHAAVDATAAGSKARAQGLMVGLIHSAHSAARVTRWTAGREPDNPRVFDVDHPTSVVERSVVPGLAVADLLRLVGMEELGAGPSTAQETQSRPEPTPLSINRSTPPEEEGPSEEKEVA
jgi:hypothetical protein